MQRLDSEHAAVPRPQSVEISGQTLFQILTRRSRGRSRNEGLASEAK